MLYHVNQMSPNRSRSTIVCHGDKARLNACSSCTFVRIFRESNKLKSLMLFLSSVARFMPHPLENVRIIMPHSTRTSLDTNQSPKFAGISELGFIRELIFYTFFLKILILRMYGEPGVEPRMRHPLISLQTSRDAATNVT